MVRSVPISSRAAKSTLYDTERFDELAPSGTRSRRLDASAEAARSVANRTGLGTCLGPHSASTARAGGDDDRHEERRGERLRAVGS